MTSPHPATLPIDALLAECEATHTRRSGPGGQHRNKVETAVVLRHVPTDVRAEANERRSQHENHRVAVFRLRVRLALTVRAPATEPSPCWRSRCHAGRLAVSAEHDDFPALLAEALDVLAAEHGDMKRAAERLAVTSSQLTKFFAKEPAALRQINLQRQADGLRPLRA